MRPNKAKTGFIESFGYALAGIRATVTERNFMVELGMAALALALGFVLRIQPAEWLAVAICIGLVLGFECMNTALEAVVDMCTESFHPLAKLAKDAAAGAVLCVSGAAFAVGLIIFLPKILVLLRLAG